MGGPHNNSRHTDAQEGDGGINPRELSSPDVQSKFSLCLGLDLPCNRTGTDLRPDPLYKGQQGTPGRMINLLR
jgi:hypothetical protein